MNLKHTWEVWGEWEIRVLVLSSLALQVFLLFAGGLRKRVAEWWLRMPLWLAYLLADYIAIYALGNLSQNQKLCGGSRDAEMHVLVFWAPFLILHLGGQDTITAFAVEDNELWLRHFLSLVSQVVLAGYVYWKSRPGVRLMVPAAVMFVAGVTKYGERTLALRAASMGSLRSSMLTPPDPGPNYAKFVEECQSRTDAGLVARIVIVPERPPNGDAHVEVRREEYGDLVCAAHRFFHTFRRLFVDLILSFQDRIDSLAFFRRLEMEQAFKVVEIELVLMYESLHSKAPVIHGQLGRGLRVLTLAAPVVSLVLFTRAAGDMEEGYARVDVGISYVLLGGAIFLEFYAILLMVISPWTYADLRASERLRLAAELVFWVMRSFQPETRPRWSNRMSQYNLISYCLKDKPRWSKGFMERVEWRWNFRVKTMWDSWRYTKKITVSERLKRLVFEQLKSKASSSSMDPKSYRKLGEHRGQWALQRKGLYQQLGWSVDCEFDESVLLWHIATDLCFYADRGGSGSTTNAADEQGDVQLHAVPAGDAPIHDDGEHLADPVWGHLRRGQELLPAGGGDLRRAGLRGQAPGRGHLHRRAREGGQEQVGALPGVQARWAAAGAGRRDGGQAVAARRQRVVEMLCYAAGKCSGGAHARQLSQGGELLTVVWLLMAHFGVGDQYRVESGHARAKLVVDT